MTSSKSDVSVKDLDSEMTLQHILEQYGHEKLETEQN